uniref:NADH dehydrogenase subunit 6 n=2 Tax=Wuchereria bancrofti TaxID=6293 RepID=H9CHV6_WUCBA|nr:NADH dehydrogenase subunit 6 [Wuchereria bancrofti]
MCFFYFSFFLSLLFFCLSFLDWDPMKSCISMCLGILFMSCYISLGVHVWYSYFIVLIFLSGIFSLLTYFCSLSGYCYYYNYNYFLFVFIFFCFLFFVFFDYDFFSFNLGYDFLGICYDFNFYYVFWVVLVLFLLLSLISINLSYGMFMRGL